MAYKPFITHHSSPVVLLTRADAGDLPKVHLEKYHSCKGKGVEGLGGSSPIPHQTAAPIYYILIFSQV